MAARAAPARVAWAVAWAAAWAAWAAGMGGSAGGMGGGGMSAGGMGGMGGGGMGPAWRGCTAWVRPRCSSSTRAVPRWAGGGGFGGGGRGGRRLPHADHDNAGPLFAGDRRHYLRERRIQTGATTMITINPLRSATRMMRTLLAGTVLAAGLGHDRSGRPPPPPTKPAAAHPHQPAVPGRHRDQQHAQDQRRGVGVQDGAREPARPRHGLPDRELLLLQVQLRRRAVLRQHPARERAARPGPGALRLRAGIHRMEGTGPGGVQGAQQG